MTGYRPFIDVPSWIDHHLLNVLTFNVDALRLSAYFHKPNNGPLTFGPLWDFDRALRSTDGRDLNPKVWRSGSGDRGTDFFNYVWWDRLFKDPDFYQEYIDRYEVLRRGSFSIPQLYHLVDSLVDQVREAQPREAKRWGQRARGGYPKEIADLKTWLSNRVAFIDGQFVRPPGPFIPDLFRRTPVIGFIPAPNTTVYYTLDGTDPRLPGGTVAPGALTWSGSVSLPTNGVLTTRAFNPQHKALVGANNPPLKSLWSGLVKEPILVTPPPVGLTEIHFNPPPTAGIADPQTLEFIELRNTSDVPFDFSGFRLRDGIDFTCPSNATVLVHGGGRLVVARDPAVFRARHPDATRVVGPFSGRLANEGDTIRLEGRFGEPVGAVTYHSEWSAEADGGGYSLVPRYEGSSFADLAEASGWRRSAFRGGSPGEPDVASIPDLELRVTTGEDGVRIGFQTDLGREYTIWARNDLNAGTVWERLGLVQASALPARSEWLDASGVSPRYYRVTVP